MMTFNKLTSSLAPTPWLAYPALVISLALAMSFPGQAVYAGGGGFDVGGSWQANVDCPGSLTTATLFLSIVQDGGTGQLDVTVAPGGTTFLDGEVRELTITTLPAPILGLIAGTGVTIPDSGLFVFDTIFDSPFPYLTCVDPPLARIITQGSIDGTVTEDDGAGTATRIEYVSTQGSSDFFDTMGLPCFSSPVGSGCNLLTLRNDVAVGLGQTVEPLEGSAVTFAQVTAAGTASVVPLTEPAGQVPANFQLFDVPIFYDVSTTASVLPPITVCLPYPDADQDGFVDGTSPPIDEDDLKILHQEGGSFVDRTISLDPVIDQICAQVTGLSQFVAGAGAAPPPPALTIPDAFTPAYQPVDVAIELIASGNDLAAVAFSVDYDQGCLSFDDADGDGDGIPDAIGFDVPAGFATTVFFDAGDLDGEIDVIIARIPPVDTLPDGVPATVTFQPICTPAQDEILPAPVLFSSDPPPSFGDTLGQSVPGLATGGVIHIMGGQPGDCNGDTAVDAGDLTACGLELFDGDGNFWLDAAGGTFAGSPVGCDANADTVIDAGDVSCKGRLLFGLGCGGGGRDPSTTVSAELSIPADLAVASDRTVVVPVRFRPHGDAINSVVFSLDFDQTALRFDDTDPTSIRFLGAARVQSVSYQPEDGGGELDFIVADLGADPRAFAAGVLLEIVFEALNPGDVVSSAVVFSRDPVASFGDLAGRSMPGSAAEILFADDFESGDASAWSRVVE